MVKNYNSSKSNTSAVKDGDGGGPDDTQGTDYHTTRSNNTEIDTGGGGGPDIPTTKNYNSSKSNTSSVSDGDLVGDGGTGEPAMTKNYNSSKSNTSSISVEDDLVGDGGGGGGPDEAQGTDYHTTRSNNTSVSDGGLADDQDLGLYRSWRWEQSSGGGTGVIGSTLGIAKTVIMVAILLTAAGVGFDLYQTYNDAIDLNLEDHVTDADFALNGDKTEINGDIGFNIPEMGMFEKKILAQVHVTVLESSPTTDGDYSFKYTLGSGEQPYEFSLTNLDPVTVAKIDAGEDLELEYTTSITVIYLGVELAPATTDMPARIVTVETA